MATAKANEFKKENVNLSLKKNNPKKEAHLRLLFFITTLLAISPSLSLAQDNSFRVSLGSEYNTGKYGTEDRTSIFYTPLSLEYETTFFRFIANIPFVSINGPGSSVSGPNSPIVTDAQDSFKTRESGLGDVVGSITWISNPFSESWPIFELTGQVKFPTASSSKNLGTGETDFILQGDLYKVINESFVPYLGVGYIFFGKADELGLTNSGFIYLGASQDLNDKWTIGSSFEFMEKTSKDSSHQADIVPYIAVNLSENFSLTLYGDFGLTNSSPDYGAGIQISYYS